MDPVLGLLGGDLHKMEREIRLARSQRRLEWMIARSATGRLSGKRALAAWTGARLVATGEALRAWAGHAQMPANISERRAG